MQVVIFCGGLGTRLTELTEEIPKPLIEIGDRPVLWHIMKIYSYYGINDFILCLGYKGDKIKDYFLKSSLRNNDFSIINNKINLHTKNEEKWNITFVDTGENATKAERLMKVKKYIQGDNFCVAYGDDVSDVNIYELIKFHLKHKKIATITAVQIANQYGVLEFNEDKLITLFKEKPLMKEWINGGFMVFNKKIFDYIKSGFELEKEIFENLSKDKQIYAFTHNGFWKGMNIIKDTKDLNALWRDGKAKWKVWK
ncbi:MAG: sugar phosphate nucleotidyltransferase [Candidatus Nanoarchaeia archaeon]